MTQTVIGFFRNSADAFRAADTLRDRGFDIDNVDVMTNRGEKNSSNDDEKSSKIGNFFKSLFSDNDEDAERYSKFAGNNSMVTVHASDHDEAERAADVLDSCGAIDIDNGDDYSGNEGRLTDSDFSSSRDDFGRRDLEEADFDSTRPQKNYHRQIDVNDDLNSDISSEDDMDLRDDTDLDSDLSHVGDIDDDRRRFTDEGDIDNTSEASIPVIDEEVNVGKRQVRRGGVRVRSRIISRPVEETLRLREEHIRVERTPVDRDATDADLDNLSDETVEVHAYGEEPVVSKRSRVVEEVRVGKEVRERKETVRERARKTEIDIENIDDENITDSDKV
ncbi:MAG TPA: YsnF/AvaK domain-containing protein [Bacteroidales bacterium]|nr:YsnF/AvaK domain-containing protein [Bacteroidales bacterium]